MPEHVDPRLEFAQLWRHYVAVVRQLVIVRQRRPPRTFLAAFDLFFEESFGALGDETFVGDFAAAWEEFEADESNRVTSRLLRLEIAAFINGFQDVTSATLAPNADPPSTQRWLSRDATARDMISAGKTLVESLLDALGDLIPVWVRGVLKILKEVLDVAGG